MEQKQTQPNLVGCGICGNYHPEGFRGDCRDDDNRYPTDDPRDRKLERAWMRKHFDA